MTDNHRAVAAKAAMIRVKATSVGRKLLKHTKKIKLTMKATFEPATEPRSRSADR